MKTEDFGNALKNLGFGDFAGVPCSYLSPLINWALNEKRFLMANNEGDAVAIASGWSLAQGGKGFGVVLMQNSGLSNALSPLTSLNAIFDIPILGFVSLRGERDAKGNNTDEPQHELLGKITADLLQLCGIPHAFLSADLAEAKKQLNEAKSFLENGNTFFFIVRKKVLEDVALNAVENFKSEKRSAKNFPILEAKVSQFEVLKSIQKIGKNAALLATTGFCGRSLFDLGDFENQVYMVGSMGCVSSLGLGIALKSEIPVICLDGDSALLMRLGALPANAFYGKDAQLCHVLFNNACHKSTGGQKNLSPFVDFAQIANACGYAKTAKTNSIAEVEAFVGDFLKGDKKGAHFLEVVINDSVPSTLSRPNVAPRDVARRFAKWLGKRKKNAKV